MARAIGAKKQKKPKAKLFTLDQPKHKPNFEIQLRPPGLQQVCSRTIEKDVLGLFTTESTSSQNARQNVTKALNNRLRVVERQNNEGNPTMTELPVLRIRGTNIKQSEFQRFCDETWLNDTLIYCFLKKYVQDMLNDVYCFDTHFFTRLWHNRYYNYDNVKR